MTLLERFSSTGYVRADVNAEAWDMFTTAGFRSFLIGFLMWIHSYSAVFLKSLKVDSLAK
jgi:hypothetical protein